MQTDRQIFAEVLQRRMGCGAFARKQTVTAGPVLHMIHMILSAHAWRVRWSAARFLLGALSAARACLQEPLSISRANAQRRVLAPADDVLQGSSCSSLRTTHVFDVGAATKDLVYEVLLLIEAQHPTRNHLKSV